MPQILVVDDSPIDRLMAGRILQDGGAMTIRYATDGADALAQIRQELPDAVVTDLHMPNLDGLQLVASIKDYCPLLPVILMTAMGSEEIAANALRAGAASYVPKSSLARHLAPEVSRIVHSAATDRQHSRLMHNLSECHCRFTLGNDEDLIEPLAARLQEMLRCVPLADEADRLRVGIAIKHALINGLYHGNLEIPPDVSGIESPEIRSLIDERITDPVYCYRKLVVEANLTSLAAEFHIKHEGPGFDQSQLPIGFDGVQSTSHLGRGWILMQSSMDGVTLSGDGRMQTLIKKAIAQSDWVFEE